jgi:Fe-S-cluster containining protein
MSIITCCPFNNLRLFEKFFLLSDVNTLVVRSAWLSPLSVSRLHGCNLSLMTNFAQACIFLKDKACTIHPVRPRQCSTYPWWPELINKESWDYEREHICEGLDHVEAPLCDLMEAGEQLQLATVHFAARDAAQHRRRRDEVPQ